MKPDAEKSGQEETAMPGFEEPFTGMRAGRKLNKPELVRARDAASQSGHLARNGIAGTR